MSKRPKNKYCLNSRLSEREFEILLWTYINIYGATPAVSELDKQFQVSLSRQTVNRYMLLFGDYFFAKHGYSGNELIHAIYTLYGLHRALYDRSIKPYESPEYRSTAEKVVDGMTSFFQSNRIFGFVFEAMLAQSKHRRGISLSTISSYFGTFERRIMVYLEVVGKTTKPFEFERRCYEEMRLEFLADPIDPTSLEKYRFLEKDEFLIVNKFIGSKLVETKEYPIK